MQAVHDAVECHTMQFDAVQHDGLQQMQHNILEYNAMLWSTTQLQCNEQWLQQQK